ncbi:hypothetical protein ACFFX1_00525 [Dactylosporangium sucinum]|uniref:Lipoprotein n=1 Tax=Dactylosporangium sucinum TaxID=1424081 RepID=A0A917TGE3_9ACTN|nr:hypothetical protein [Dactylosporangium sucinum]GGM21430.1 hypothetical protein GCM10007977_023180 [Dactylosporangium sucinum]
MKLAWGRAAATIAAATLMFGTTACADATESTGTPGAAATTSKAPEAKQVLLGSLAEYDKGVYAMEFTGRDNKGSGAIDATKKHAYMKMVSTDPDAAFTMEILLLDPDAYLKMDMGDLAKQLPGMSLMTGKTWMHLDKAKITDADTLGIKEDESDMLDLKALLDSAKDVKTSGDGKFTGTLDLAKGDDSPMTDEAVVKALADKAAAVPFTATVDAQGRFSDMTIDVPAAGETKPHQLTLKVTQYGTVTIPAKPTGKAVVEAPASAYEILNG